MTQDKEFRINLKPLSVNEAWQGRRFKTEKHKIFSRSMAFMLPALTVPDGRLCIEMVFGFSSDLADLDNPLKPTIDAMQRKYGFNDRRIYRLSVEKVIVAKGNEFISFKIYKYE